MAAIKTWISTANEWLDKEMREDRSWKFGITLCVLLVLLSIVVGWLVSVSLGFAFWMGSLALAIFLERLSTSRYTLLSIPSTILAFGGIGGLVIRGTSETFTMHLALWILWGVLAVGVFIRVFWNIRHYDGQG